ncbi:BTAD domain-containing putative transcriptional regulator [Plantactinospora sp. KBS50]|uniref:AfsR/SARP family transcriptional regulator n=1 Tax=Plantactinospora sp. KBS50 TaxID=2024580 RepID=UPI0018DFA6DB|nr:BTAD domain-containing putative transcriptional regulator [Plantactinospora sp. KBS50]
MLAALAVDAGTPVSSEALADRVWGMAAPEGSRSSLYAHVARLRRALSEADDDGEGPIGLIRHDDGYLLNIDRRLVDHHRFQELVEVSRAATRPDERIELLSEAMNLWRGTPLSTLTSDWMLRVRRTIEYQFTGLAAAWGAEELRRGRADVVSDRLAQLVGAYPLAEPLVGLQMRALCAVGRVSEALQCYADARSQIVEQLGAEPGPELRRMHLAVLRGELDKEPRAEVVLHRPTARETPRQLPTDLSRFVGRARELTRVLGSFTPSGHHGPAPVVNIYGAAGIGKSTLAIHAGHRLVERYPDGQIYLDLRGSGSAMAPLSPAEALARLLRTLHGATPYKPVQVDEAAALFRSLVAGRRLLLVLDNATDAGQVNPLLPSGTGCGTIVTSLQPLTGLVDAGQVWMGALSVDEAVALLGQWVGAARIAAEPEAAAAIARWCECLPLALRIAGARLVARPGWPLAELRDRLADERRRLDNLELDGIGLRASIGGSYHRLSRSTDLRERATAEAFKLLGAADEPELDRCAAARVLTRSEADAERVLECLVDAQLLETSSPGSYRMGDLVRLYARERFAGRQDDEPARQVSEGAGTP